MAAEICLLARGEECVFQFLRDVQILVSAVHENTLCVEQCGLVVADGELLDGTGIEDTGFFDGLRVFPCTGCAGLCRIVLIREAELTGDDVHGPAFVGGIECHFRLVGGEDEQVVSRVQLINDTRLSDAVGGEVAAAAVDGDGDLVVAFADEPCQIQRIVDLVGLVVGILSECGKRAVDVYRVIGVCADVHGIRGGGRFHAERLTEVDVGVFRFAVSGIPQPAGVFKKCHLDGTSVIHKISLFHYSRFSGKMQGNCAIFLRKSMQSEKVPQI